MIARPSVICPLIVALAGLSFCWPLLSFGYPQHTDDVVWHIIWSEQFLRELSSGVLYPRWLPDMNDGLGSPSFFFYYPLPYYLTSLLGFVSGDRKGLDLLAMATPVLLAGSGLAAYGWLRLWVRPVSALFGAIAYMAMPYHLLFDLWIRSAFAEFAGFLWLPLLFQAVEWVRADRRYAVPFFAGLFALLLTTHLITAMLACGVIALYMLLRLRGARAYGQSILAVVLGLGLSAVYLVPALALRGQVAIGAPVLSDGLFMLSAFAGHEAAPRPGFWGLLHELFALETVAVMLLFGGLLITRKAGPPLQWRIGLTWTGLTLALLLSMTIWFAPLWRLLPVLRNVQFPFRLEALVALGLSAAGAVTLDRLTERFGRLIPGIGLVAIVAFGLAEVAPALWRGNFDESKVGWHALEAAKGDSGVFRPTASIGRLPLDTPPGGPLPAARVLVSSGEGAAHILSWRARHIVIAADADAPVSLDVAQLYFTGWQAAAAGATLPVSPAPETGLVRIAAPAGHYTIDLRLTPGLSETAGWTVSALSCLVWAGSFVVRRRSVIGGETFRSKPG